MQQRWCSFLLLCCKGMPCENNEMICRVKLCSSTADHRVQPTNRVAHGAKNETRQPKYHSLQLDRSNASVSIYQQNDKHGQLTILSASPPSLPVLRLSDLSWHAHQRVYRSILELKTRNYVSKNSRSCQSSDQICCVCSILYTA